MTIKEKMIKTFGFILLATLFISCDNILPFPTKSGRNIFGWKADGMKLRTTKYNILRDNPIFAQMTDSSVYVSGQDYNDRMSVYIGISNISKKGTYQLDNSNVALYIDNNYPRKTYTTTSKYGGRIIVTSFDMKSRIVSGKFSFNAVRLNNSVYPNTYDTTDIVEVTRGRFDIDLNKLKK